MRHFLANTSQSAARLVKLGFVHGKEFDCQQVECRVCIPYREKEIEEVSSMTLEEKESLTWGVMK